MSWSIEYHKEADKFLSKNQNISAPLKETLKEFIRFLQGETASINLKKLSGKWEGYHRIRKGDVRIIFDFDHNEQSIYVRKIDFRGKVY
ncbi:MAG TPA: type II toxin-antitoxin system RelE/ParE family toxin [Spirochaetota bacterium]|nr:type II toxin-antitoxin system RelE/ParE family toxin [Spirochaetota bacterium]